MKLIWKNKAIDVPNVALQKEFIRISVHYDVSILVKTAGGRDYVIDPSEVICPDGVEGWRYDEEKNKFVPILNELGQEAWEKERSEMALLCKYKYLRL